MSERGTRADKKRLGLCGDQVLLKLAALITHTFCHKVKHQCQKKERDLKFILCMQVRDTIMM